MAQRRPTEGRHERIASRKKRASGPSAAMAGRVAGPPYRLENTPLRAVEGASGMLRFIYAENAITIRLREGPRSC